ncbi:MAG: DUF3445 domain-containing protein [Rhizobiaceae bacterium]
MVVAPKHTPYDGDTPQFKIGLQPLDMADWIEVDDDLEIYLAEKDRLISEFPEQVFAAEAGTEEAQQEILDLLVSYLLENFSKIYQLRDGAMVFGDRVVDLNGANDTSVPPLMIAAKLVQEDLVLMRQQEDGWRIAAGSVSFPSSWDLVEKFSLVLQDVHKNVPGFEPGTRNAHMINRIFDNLLVDQPVRRFNWSAYADPQLYHGGKKAISLPSLNKDTREDSIFLRVEHQTLRKLAISGGILFTIRIHIDPLAALRAHPSGDELCHGIVAQLELLDHDQLAYKGLVGAKDNLVAKLQAIHSGEKN